jgi:hypothetical protein
MSGNCREYGIPIRALNKKGAGGNIEAEKKFRKKVGITKNLVIHL